MNEENSFHLYDRKIDDNNNVLIRKIVLYFHFFQRILQFPLIFFENFYLFRHRQTACSAKVDLT